MQPHHPLDVTPLLTGHLSVENVNGLTVPRRMTPRVDQLAKPELWLRGGVSSGVRLSLQIDGDASRLHLEVAPPGPEYNVKKLPETWSFDLTLDDERIDRQTIPYGPGTASFDISNVPQGKRLELYLPHNAATGIKRFLVEGDPASVKRAKPAGPRWLVHGSSITQSSGAPFPTETWPALVGRTLGLDWINLGYSGSCRFENFVSRMIAAEPADHISLCFGINVMEDYSYRTLHAAVIGFIDTLRDAKPDVPIVICSPLFCGPRESTPGPAGTTLQGIRAEIVDAASKLQSLGDTHLHYIDGLTLLGPDDAHHLPDEVHPSGAGYRVLAQRYIDRVMPTFGFTPRTALD